MILSRVKFYPQERVDLEDIESLLSGARTDAKFWTRQFMSADNYIVKGFSVTGLGLKAATVNMEDATLIMGGGTSDFSYFIAEESPDDIIIPDADLVDGVRNYVEIQLAYEDGTPLTKAFWDPSANGGEGAEFNQQVDKAKDIVATAIVVQGGFTGDPDRVPVAIIDTDVSGNIKVILDERDLFYSNEDFSWGSNSEPVHTIVLTGGSGTYVANETVTFSGGATATVAVGGTTTISIRGLSNNNFANGNTLVGGTSGASRTVNTVAEDFFNADKDIDNFRDSLTAIMTEIKRLKGTSFWYNIQSNSLNGISAFLNHAIVGLTSGARYHWDGSALTITDDSGTPAAADDLARLRFFGKSQVISLSRQDGSGGSAIIPVADGQMIFVKIPSSGNRDFSGVGSGDTNYQVVSHTAFVVNDENFWIAYREGSKIYVRGYGELMTGESAEISDPVSSEILTFIGAINEADSDPNYISSPAGSLALPNFNTSNGESLTARLAKVTSMLADLKQDLNIALNPGAITWDGTNITVTGASLSVPGTTVGAAPVSINTLGSTALPANSCLYVDISRTVGTALTLVVSTLAALTPSQQRLILLRNIAGSILVD